MHRMAELVYRLHLHEVISMAAKIFQIPGQGCGITAYIDDTLWCHLTHHGKEGFLAAFAWRVHYDNFCTGFFAMGGTVCRIDFLCFPNEKFCIGDVVSKSILFGICDCLRYNFHTVNLLRFLCQK